MNLGAPGLAFETGEGTNLRDKIMLSQVWASEKRRSRKCELPGPLSSRITLARLPCDRLRFCASISVSRIPFARCIQHKRRTCHQTRRDCPALAILVVGELNTPSRNAGHRSRSLDI